MKDNVYCHAIIRHLTSRGTRKYDSTMTKDEDTCKKCVDGSGQTSCSSFATVVRDGSAMHPFDVDLVF